MDDSPDSSRGPRRRDRHGGRGPGWWAASTKGRGASGGNRMLPPRERARGERQSRGDRLSAEQREDGMHVVTALELQDRLFEGVERVAGQGGVVAEFLA